MANEGKKAVINIAVVPFKAFWRHLALPPVAKRCLYHCLFVHNWHGQQPRSCTPPMGQLNTFCVTAANSQRQGSSFQPHSANWTATHSQRRLGISGHSCVFRQSPKRLKKPHFTFWRTRAHLNCYWDDTRMKHTSFTNFVGLPGYDDDLLNFMPFLWFFNPWCCLCPCHFHAVFSYFIHFLPIIYQAFLSLLISYTHPHSAWCFHNDIVQL